MATTPFRGAWSIGSSQRVQQIIRSDAPGPGTYELGKTSKTNSPKWSMNPRNDKQSAFYVKDKMPAPGQYDIPTLMKISKHSKKSKEHNIFNEKSRSVPRYYSTGSYLNLPSSIDTKKGYAFGYRSEVTVPNRSPGPLYNVNDRSDFLKSQKMKNKGSGFGFGEKNSIYKDIRRDTPGPGSYSCEKQNRSSTSVGGNILFPKDQRKILHHNNCSNQLGPGSYNPQMLIYEKGCRIQGRHKPEKKDSMENIGPGSYKIPEIKSPTAVRFVESKRQDMKDKQSAYNPSPFEYNPKRFPEAYRSSDGFRMGYAQRKTLQHEDTPGPGEYQIPSGLNKHGITIATKLKNQTQLSGIVSARKHKNLIHSGRDKLQSQNSNPNYDYVKFKSPAFSFPTEPLPFDKAPEQNKNGPGTYNINNSSSSEKFSISKAPRFNESQDAEVDYFSPNIPSGIGYIPKYLLKPKKDS